MVYISAGLSDSVRNYAGFQVLELIFCIADMTLQLAISKIVEYSANFTLDLS